MNVFSLLAYELSEAIVFWKLKVGDYHELFPVPESDTSSSSLPQSSVVVRKHIKNTSMRHYREHTHTVVCLDSVLRAPSRCTNYSQTFLEPDAYSYPDLYATKENMRTPFFPTCKMVLKRCKDKFLFREIAAGKTMRWAWDIRGDRWGDTEAGGWNNKKQKALLR